MRIQVLYFAQLREAMERDSEYLDVGDDGTVADAVALLRSRSAWESVAGLPVVYAVNEEVTSANRRLTDGDRLALLTPVSGG